MLAFSLAVFLALLVVNYYIQPCRGKGATANNMRTANFAACTFGTICAIVSYIINNVRSRPGPAHSPASLVALEVARGLWEVACVALGGRGRGRGVLYAQE